MYLLTLRDNSIINTTTIKNAVTATETECHSMSLQLCLSNCENRQTSHAADNELMIKATKLKRKFVGENAYLIGIHKQN